MKTWPALDIRFPDAVAAHDRPTVAADTVTLPDLVHATLADFSVTAIHEGTAGSRPAEWRIFFATPSSRDEARAALSATVGFAGISLASMDVDDEDWAARSQASVRAVRIGHIVVAPPWDAAHEAPIVIVIEPSMGFGTGHHATTRLCLHALQHVDLPGAHVLDVGTGSGVLAIAARRLGASRVLGIDDDVDAIESARKNLELNPEVDVTLGVVDVRRATLRPVDVVIGNLTGALLVSIAATLKTLSHGRLILSGFMKDERPAVLAAFDGWAVEREALEDEWICVTLLKRWTKDPM